MDLIQLRMFVAVAEERHFRRAAARCFVAQPALSRRIQALERELAVQLFRRTKRSVELTEAGQRFLETARATLARIDQGTAELRCLSDSRDALHVGGVEFTNFPFLPPTLRQFRARCPNQRIVRYDMDAARQIPALLGGELDIGFFARPHGQTALVSEPIMAVQWQLAMPVGHHLTDRPSIAVEDLAGEPLVLFARVVNPGLYDWIIERLRHSGIEPEVVHAPAQLHTTLSMVAAGFGVFPTPFFLDDQRQAGIVLRPLDGYDLGWWVNAVWRRGDESHLLREFLASLHDVVHGVPPAAAAS